MRISEDIKVLHIAELHTAIGSMIAVADETKLYFLDFSDRIDLEKRLKRLKQKTASEFILGYRQPINSIERELSQYFNGKLKEFKTPLCFLGSSFQKSVWKELQKIPFGNTRSYSDIAISIGKASSFRAVAQTNGANRFALIVPCHRVINKNGRLGGYSGGLSRKQWLLNHETNRK